MRLFLVLTFFLLSSTQAFSQAGLRPPEIPDDPYRPLPEDTRERTPPYRVSSRGFFFTQVNVDSNGMNIVGDAANEPSIAVDPNDNTKIAIGWRQFDTITNNFRQAGNGYTTDGGLTWNYNDVIERGVFRSDPVLDSDADGNFYYNSLTTVGPDFVCDVFKSTDGGATWDDKTFAWGGDKQWMAIDRTNGIGRGNIYSNWTSFFSSCPPGNTTRSPDNGVTYDNCVEVPSIPYWGTLSVGANGNLFFGGFDLSTDDFQVVRSTTAQDPGQTPMTWDDDVQVDLGGQVAGNQGNSSPNPGGILGQVWVATDHSVGPTAGNVYLLCAAEPDTGPDPLDVMFSRSTDDGLTWSAPIRVYEDPDDEWQWMGTVSVAPNGRIDVIWLDTRDNPGTVLSSLYYSNSIDGGVSWSPPERISDEFDPHVGWPNQNKMGDYFDMVSDNDGAHLAWAATFNGEQDVYYARILAEAFVPEAPVLSVPADGSTGHAIALSLVWEPALGATGYHVQLDNDAGFTSPLVDDSTVTDIYTNVSGLARGTTYYWRARAKSSGGWGPWSGAWSFSTGEDPPAPPALVSPPDMAVAVPPTSTFEWSDTASTVTWNLQISTVDNFLDPEVNLTGLTQTSQQVADLAGETLHYWRVSGSRAGGQSVWTPAWSFTTGMAPPAAPNLLAPPDGFINPSTTILFRWDGSDGASSYHFQLAIDDQFAVLAVNDSSITSTTRITTNLTDGEEYFWRVAAQNDGGKSSWSEVWSVTVLTTGVEEEEGLPTEFSLGQNYPNPFNPATVISFAVPKKSHVLVEVFDILGKQVAVLASREYEPGRYEVSFNAGSLGGGVYFYRMTGENFVATKKLLLVK